MKDTGNNMTSNYSKGKLVFPRDEGDKDTLYDWWFLTSHFVTKSEKKFTYTVVYFGTDPTYYARQISLTDESAKKYFVQVRKGPFLSKKGLFNIVYTNSDGDHDHWRQIDGKLFQYRLFAEIRGYNALNVTLTANKPPLVHGNGGLMHMGTAGESFYYSQTNLSLNGTFTHDGITEQVSGMAWIDRQWGDWKEGHDEWEWFALQLNDNTEIMLYLFYDVKSGRRNTPCLSIMFGDGTSLDLSSEKEFSLQALDYWEADENFKQRMGALFLKRLFSSGWRFRIPRCNIDLFIIPVIKNQRLRTWEGSCYVQGTHNGTIINCVGTVELTHLYCEPYPVRRAKTLLRMFILEVLNLFHLKYDFQGHHSV
jgi:predicted secreted hydrolase